MDYREADDLYFAIIEEHGTDLFSTVSSTAFPWTFRAMFNFCAKTNSLKTALFDLIESENPYAFKAIFRCFCEHYLRFMYIWSRFISEKSDEVGLEYYKFCGATEALDYVGAISAAEGILGNNVVINTKLAIEGLYPEAAKLSKKELEQFSNQFKYRTIIRYLSKEQFGFVSQRYPFLAQIIPDYALLSSFVHGGPYTDLEMAECAQPNALAECENYAELAFMMTASAFMCTAMAVASEHPSFGFIATKVLKVIRAFTQEHNE